MALNQLKTVELLKTINYDNFIPLLMEAYDFAKSTITMVMNRDKRNIAPKDAINEHAVKDKFWAIKVTDGTDLYEAVESLVTNRQIIKINSKTKKAQALVRYLIAYDKHGIVIKDIKLEEVIHVNYDELHLNYGFLLVLAGIETAKDYGEHPADAKAAIKMGKLFDYIVSENKIETKDDERAIGNFLTRVLFCFFAENTAIFEKKQFTKAIELYTNEDGTDLNDFMYELFDVLNTKESDKKRNIFPAHLKAFPYVNGGLFKADETIPVFNNRVRKIIIECGKLDWSKINPDIFGSMFQAITNTEQRSSLGQHYTSYTNIMKTISPLFLDELKEELASANKVEKLNALLKRLRNIKIFDPACGSGNFLITAYKELRALEMEIIKKGITLNENFNVNQNSLDLSDEENKEISLKNFYGIEIDSFPSEIAKLSLWLAEHQMNAIWKEEMGEVRATLPLGEGGNVVCSNALRVDWNKVCPNNGTDEIYVIGNPPFLGTLGRTKEQREDMLEVFKGFKNSSKMDFVTCWFWKGANYIKDTYAKLALVSTNSICQGEQVDGLWSPLLELGVEIEFAYTSFPWSNKAKNNAGVTVIVIGLRNKNKGKEKYIYDYNGNTWSVKKVSNISPYLIEGSDQIVTPMSKPICKNVLKMVKGNMPTDGGHLFLNNQKEYDNFLEKEPSAKQWVRKVVGSEEYINDKQRWCLWFDDCELDILDKIPAIKNRLLLVKDMRKNSPKLSTHKLADTPHLFELIVQPTQGEYLTFPIVSSERRKYIPIGFLDHTVIATNLVNILPNATIYEFGILTSLMHNEWVKLVGSKLKNDTRYTSRSVYNTFPWPKVTEEQRKYIEELAEEVYLTRDDYPDKTLAQLYDPNLMPEPLRVAHDKLDKAVEELYKEGGFKNKEERLSHLLKLYKELTE